MFDQLLNSDEVIMMSSNTVLSIATLYSLFILVFLQVLRNNLISNSLSEGSKILTLLIFKLLRLYEAAACYLTF